MREAVIHIPQSTFEEMGIAEFITACRDAGLRDITELACQRDGCLLVVSVDSRIPEAKLGNLEYLKWWEQLRSSTENETYLCKVAIPEFTETAQSALELDVSNDEMRVSTDGFDITLVGPHEDISQSIQQYRDAGMSVFLQRINEYDGPSSVLDKLTERQREVLEIAFRRGYFEVPRAVSAAEIASEVDLDPSTVSEHLQRAERNILAELLAPTNHH